ncbi:rhodanese-like domain-containing protein [Psychroserpens algicola]|uniref:Rhodanese-like domain-containing protein n=1 Tax=Psychroserpens algicola TaxID=1719034 RepID=A0ABT0HAJ2_9FLAO|nr:rhodanese-like domain-containing protein [Psychroserpens algicola]MCK8480862.1 rhodanese-like domain-containing protein [Psychroserpens algicola]
MNIPNQEFEHIQEYLDKGAIVLDVRTEAEYNEGHVEGALHIVLDELEDEIEQLTALQKPIITCCRSGARSEHAKDLLLDYEIDAINGGPWQNVKSYL